MLHHHSMRIKTMKAVDTTVDTPIVVAEEDAACNTDEISNVDKVVGATVI